MAEQASAGRIRVQRELLAVLGGAVLVVVIAVIVSATRGEGTPAPASALLAASPTAAPRTPTAEPTPEPTPTAIVVAWAEVGVAAVEAPPPEPTVQVVTPEVARQMPSVPVIIDTTGFGAPPPRRSAPSNSAGISRVVSSSLDIDHYVEVLRVVGNTMQTPKDGSYAVGWYEDYARPGSGGNVVVSAHETWNHMQGPFFRLHDAQPGDEIAILMADGRQYRYAVFSNVRYSVDNIPMAEILWPTRRPQGEEWLTLFTCGGRIVYDRNGFGTYLDRDVVIARRVG